MELDQHRDHTEQLLCCSLYELGLNSPFFFKDLSDLGIFIDLMHMEQPGKKFDGRKFYKVLIFIENAEVY